MAAKVLLYNLAEHITDEEFKKYVVNEKGPLIESMSSVKKYELFKITGSAKGKVPYKYVGIVHVTSIEDFEKNDAPSQKYRDFQAKFNPMVSELQAFSAEEIY